jgi:hypothetical protein
MIFFSLEFAPKLMSVRLEPEVIRPLLVRVREICDSADCPPGRPDCRNCCILETLIGVTGKSFRSIEEDLHRSLDAECSKKAGKVNRVNRDKWS